MSRFAFTTYAKALTELKTYGRGVPLEDLEGFLIKMQTLDDTIVDFTLAKLGHGRTTKLSDGDRERIEFRFNWRCGWGGPQWSRIVS